MSTHNVAKSQPQIFKASESSITPTPHLREATSPHTPTVSRRLTRDPKSMRHMVRAATTADITRTNIYARPEVRDIKALK